MTRRTNNGYGRNDEEKQELNDKYCLIIVFFNTSQKLTTSKEKSNLVLVYFYMKKTNISSE